MERSITIDGYRFKYNEEMGMYECRGRVVYDDEHDEIPEPGLWKAALKLENHLIRAGFDAEAEHSEKGWVEVNINN
jgi:hypothetical protein